MTLSLACSLLLAAVPALDGGTRAVFEVRVLGALGGGEDGNLSSYLVGPVGASPQLLVEGGSLSNGYAAFTPEGARGSPTGRATALRSLLAGLAGVLISHSHLDHVSGFLLDTPLLLGSGRSQSLPLVALPQTLATLQTHVFGSPLWVDFTAIPKAMPAVKLAPLEPGRTLSVGDFTVETVALAHTVPSAAFVISKEGASYAHLGDTGPTEAIWARLRPLLGSHALRGVAVEVSFGTTQERLARDSGHLTPHLLLLELARLADVKPAADDLALARALAPRLAGCAIIATHIKSLDFETVTAELKAFQAEGLPLVIPSQGQTLRL